MFSKSRAFKMLEYASKSYKDIQPNDKEVQIITIDDKKTDVQCYLRKNKKSICITFRGSSSKKDYIADSKFWKKAIPYGNLSKIKVHSGFINSYKSKNVRNNIHNFIEKNINDTEEILIVGHSYGAALAILCAIDLQENFPQKDYEVYLFGAPRVGNKAFRDFYDKHIFKTFRFVNGNDIVTKIPFAIMGYRHVGISIHIGFPRIWGIFSVREHSLSRYYLSVLKSCFN